MSEEAQMADANMAEIARLTEELKETRRQLALAQHQLDNERRIPLGRYAFYHRHLAMGFVRKRDPELANWASVEAGHRIDQEGGKSFEDVVARLERWAQLWKRYAKQQRAGWRHAFEAQQRSVERWRASRERVVAQRDELSRQLAVAEAERGRLHAALTLAAPVVCSMLCPTVWKTSEGPRPHSETCQTITKLLEGATNQ